MKNASYKKILYFIGIVVFITFGIQIYWNYRNYQIGKQQLINEVQISLDNAVEEYYASNAQKKARFTVLNSQGFSLGNSFITVEEDLKLPPTTNYIDSTTHLRGNVGGHNIVIAQSDTSGLNGRVDFKPVKIYGNSVESVHRGNISFKGTDSTYKDLEIMVGKIIHSMVLDTLDLKRMDSLIKIQLKRKDIEVDFSLVFKQEKENIEQKSNEQILNKSSLMTDSKSTWLPRNSSLSIYFTNGIFSILKQNLFGIILSAILLTAVIGCLIFLLKIIKDQKQLAEIKNDLISNITHEFKTPISTIRVAMEGILNFNLDNDSEKAKKYAITSTQQVEKLNNMVEKLLETATLTGNQLKLDKEDIYVEPILETLIQKYNSLASSHKTIEFRVNQEDIKILADPFHLENAFSNILDNAVKYGGDEILVDLKFDSGRVILSFIDSGNSMSKVEATQIFDKFYRIPKGNTHDVKGFGIGLYYTKQIVERHGGNIFVEVNSSTKFIIELPKA